MEMGTLLGDFVFFGSLALTNQRPGHPEFIQMEVKIRFCELTA